MVIFFFFLEAQQLGILRNMVPAFGYISPFHYEDVASIGARREQFMFKPLRLWHS